MTDGPRLEVREGLPEGFLDARPETLHRLLPGPTLIHLPGRRPEPLFVAVLLHGNEPAGLEAVQALLADYRSRGLPRALSVFVGNVPAARAGRRRLPGQPDYNRIWGDDLLTPESRLARQVVEALLRRRVFACIDVHNNTGLNPHYAIVAELDHRHLQLAALFGRIVVYATTPVTTCTYRFAPHCPAVTVECGLPGQAGGAAHAREFIEACLHLDRLPAGPVAGGDLDLYHTVAILKVPEASSFGFGRKDVDLDLVPGMERCNFRELPAGTVLARVRPGSAARLVAWDEAGRDASERFLERRKGEIRLRRPATPAMFTSQEDIIRLDCLGYLMERLPWEGGGRG